MTLAEALYATMAMTMGLHKPRITIAPSLSELDGGLVVSISMGPLINADTGESDGTVVSRSVILDELIVRSMRGPGDLARCVGGQIKALVAHEVEEHLRFCGERVFEPHTASVIE